MDSNINPLVDSFKIRSDYLTPIDYPHQFCTSFYIELYNYNMNHTPITYVATLKLDWLSGNISRDRSSEYLGSCSLEMCLSEDNPFQLQNHFSWQNKIIKIVKVYDFLNDKNKTYDIYAPLSGANWTITDDVATSKLDYPVDRLNLGYYVVDSDTYNYDATTRTVSFSCTDALSILGSEHGGTLIDYSLGKYDVNGMVIEANQLMYDVFNSLLNTFSPIDIPDRLINVEEGYDYSGWVIPYELEFGGETTLIDVLKKVKDLYENRTLYMGVDFRFFCTKLPTLWFCENSLDYCFIRSRHISSLVISENTTVDESKVYNVYDVYGKVNEVTQTTEVEYGGSESNTTSTKSNYTDVYSTVSVFTTIVNNAVTHKTVTTVKTVTEPHNIYGLQDPKNPFSIQKIGMRKKTMTDENCLTAEDCYNKGMWQCYYDTEFRETTTVVLADNAFPIFINLDSFENLGVGKRIEYTSVHSHETNCYLLNKISHSLTDGTWTMELQRFRPLQTTDLYMEITYPENLPDSEKFPYDTDWGKWDIKTPEVSIVQGEDGQVTFTMSNEDYTIFSLFKVFIDDKFVGETCAEDENGNKIFNYIFPENGVYNIKINAYSPNFPPSENWESNITINSISNAIFIDTENNILTDEIDNILTE